MELAVCEPKTHGAASGVLIPLMLRRFRSDPALVGSVLLKTVTDVFGFLVFLGIGDVVLGLRSAEEGLRVFKYFFEKHALSCL